MPRTKVRWYSVFAAYVSHVARTYMPTFPRCPRSCCVIVFARVFSAASTLAHFFISISININNRISISSVLSLFPPLSTCHVSSNHWLQPQFLPIYSLTNRNETEMKPKKK